MSPELMRLIEMHTYQRPAGSRHERKFINRYLVPLGCRSDAFGNFFVIIGDKPRIVWSAHTDTVHRFSGKQRVALDASGVLSSVTGDCLGADDTAGVFILCEMIRRKIPGRYVFHYGEEKGCIGSRSLIASAPEWLDGIDAVIALDRKSTDDVITHQCGSRTCSDAFAQALADYLNASGLQYAPSDWGLFTDSAEYAEDVAECTNLSIGYSGAHSARETLNTNHVLALLDCLCGLDTTTLPITRIAGPDVDEDLSPLDAADETFWNRYGVPSDDMTLPVARLSRFYPCRECGEDCEDFYTVCYACGCPEPVDVIGEKDYLDASFQAAQRSIKRQLETEKVLQKTAPDTPVADALWQQYQRDKLRP